jgi:hypothetical protein
MESRVDSLARPSYWTERIVAGRSAGITMQFGRIAAVRTVILFLRTQQRESGARAKQDHFQALSEFLRHTEGGETQMHRLFEADPAIIGYAFARPRS